MDDDTAIDIAQFLAEVTAAGDRTKLDALWAEARTKKWLDVRVNGQAVRDRIAYAAKQLPTPDADRAAGAS